MKNTYGNEPVTPCYAFVEYDESNSESGDFTGLTKREEFAKAAMMGLCANGDADFCTLHSERVAEIAVSLADALINELNKPVI